MAPSDVFRMVAVVTVVLLVLSGVYFHLNFKTEKFGPKERQDESWGVLGLGGGLPVGLGGGGPTYAELERENVLLRADVAKMQKQLGLPAPTPAPAPWQAATYLKPKGVGGFDSHEKRFPKLECRAGAGGAVQLRGVIQCLPDISTCFSQNKWRYEEAYAGLAVAELPRACRPAVPHIIVGRVETFDGSLAPSVFGIDANGYLRAYSDVGAMSGGGWHVEVANVSYPGKARPNFDPVSVPDSLPVIKNRALPVRPMIAIGVPMTSNGMRLKSIDQSPLKKFAIPSFVESLPTDTNTFNVVVYAGYDAGDAFWSQAKPAEEVVAGITIRYVECPCRSMVCNTNCILKKAYDDGADYFFRSNDDTEFKVHTAVHDWITQFTRDLQALDPPNVGVVGPVCKQGNTEILTHDFVHRTHLEMFNMEYYPSKLTNWWCDDWVTAIYGNTRTIFHRSVEVLHHVMPTRYRPDGRLRAVVPGLIADARGRIRAHLKAVMQARNMDVSPQKVWKFAF